MEYNLEIDRLRKEIQVRQVKKVLLQLPDGLKSQAVAIADKIGDLASVYIWLGSCYGACDLPPVSGFLIVQFGHAPWK